MQNTIVELSERNGLETAQNFLLEAIWNWKRSKPMDDFSLMNMCVFYGLDKDLVYENLAILAEHNYLEVTDGKSFAEPDGEIIFEKNYTVTEKTKALFTNTRALAVA